MPFRGAGAVVDSPEHPGVGTAVGPAPTGLCWGEDIGGGGRVGDVGELGENWAGKCLGEKNIGVQLLLQDHAGGGLTAGGVWCRARACEGIKDMQVQERGGCSVPLVTWADQECGPVSLSPPAISQLSPAISSTGCSAQVMGEVHCKAISILLLGSGPGSGQWPPCLPLSWPRPWQTLEWGCL